MAEFTIDSRKRITDRYRQIIEEKKKRNDLSDLEKLMLSENFNISFKVVEQIEEVMDKKSYTTLSALYQKEFSELVNFCVSEGEKQAFYYELDQMNRFQMTRGWERRSLRSESYRPFIRDSIYLLRAYSRLNFYACPLSDLLTGKVSEEIYDHARTEYWAYSGILAAQIDLGNESTISAIKDIILGEGNTAMISYELIRGIVRSKSQELYQLLGNFLLAARLQEGARQAVCETMDAGQPEAFMHLFQVIEDNHLIRYSSIKRAVSTWIGIFNEKSVDRITEKLVHLMGRCLREKEFCEEQLKTEDSIAISCALWAKGFYCAQDAVEAVQKLTNEGTRHQIMTASYFSYSLQTPELRMDASKKVIKNYSDDLELVACYLPGFICDVYGYLRRLLSGDNQTYYSYQNEKVRKPKSLSVEEVFSDEKEAEELYLCLRHIISQMPKKEIIINPCIFPWHQVSMDKGDVVVRMCLIAWMLQKEEYLDEVISLLPLINSSSRSMAVRILLYRPEKQERKEILFEMLHNQDTSTMRAAFALVKEMQLTREDYIKIEKNLKYKTGRSETMNLIKRQSLPEQKESICRLLKTNSEDCHMGALDLALKIKNEHPEEFADLPPLLTVLERPTGKEQILLNELTGKSSYAQDILNTPGYGIYQPDKEWMIPPVQEDAKELLELFSYGEKAYVQVLFHLNNLIKENSDKEYKTAWDQELVLGNRLERCRFASAGNQTEEKTEPLDEYPFRELWEEFYQKEIDSPQFLLELYIYQYCRNKANYYHCSEALYEGVFGEKNKEIFSKQKNSVIQQLLDSLRYNVQISTVIDVLFHQYVPDSLKAKWGMAGTARLVSLLNHSNAIFETTYTNWNNKKEMITVRVSELPVMNRLRYWLNFVEEKDWQDAFFLRFRLALLYDQLKEQDKYSSYNRHYPYVCLRDFVICWEKGIWDKDLFYKAVFTFLGLRSVLNPASSVEKKGTISYREAGVSGLNAFFGDGAIQPVDGKYRFDTITEEEIPAIRLAHEIYQEVVPTILAVELKRGESQTPFSGLISSINVIYGIDYMIQILTALGKDTLQRGYSYSSSERKNVLSHLLSVSCPKPEETAKDLKKALKGTEITKKRLIELAMYAPQWIPILGEYLKLPALQSGCYYFIAHTCEGMDEQTISIIAKYTPLSPEELRDGAFDINWFFEAYKKLGEANFKLLYDAAKYSSEGTAHGRARKYADAALGKTEKETLKAEIQAKRNKDLLMSLGLLPLDKGKKKREEDLLDRYQFIQKFKKESSAFGAQRRASEGRAVEIALRNLSVNAGYSDVTRLTLRMETKLVEVLSDYFEWKGLEEIELKLSIDETGKSSLLCQKNKKILKAVPAKYKKHEMVLRYQELNKNLREQYRRTKQMMEQAMEDRTSFEVWEMLELSKNPVIRPIVEPLVVVNKDSSSEESPAKIGFLTKEGLVDWSGKVSEIRSNAKIFIAHPFDLYQEGHWQDYQKYLFEKKKKQPFKQIFRELYVKLSEELEKDKSLMFAGNQIQPRKTVGVLRNRRWIADYEDGLQKVYYKENIIARIYAMADWFSPSDIEAPTLEWVVFYHRKTFAPLKIKEIPDVIYSEVMRDVDLAVSTAHAGGVDPETSHSTIEMRQVIVSCNLELFKIKNVKVEGNHAVIDGKLGQYTVHLGSGVVHQMGNSMLFVVPVHSQHRGRIFLPFVDDDPKTAEIMSKILLFAEDTKIKDPNILSQIR